jgi:hypothetical protein
VQPLSPRHIGNDVADRVRAVRRVVRVPQR